MNSETKNNIPVVKADTGTVEKKFLLLNLLRQRALWLIRIRWFVPPCMALGAAIALWLGFELYWQGILGVAGFILFYNILFFVLYRWIIKENREKLRTFTSFLEAFDYVAMYFLIHYTGGISSPIVLFFIFPIILAAILLKREAAWGFANMAVIGMIGIALLEFYKVIPWHGIYYRGEAYGLLPNAPMNIIISILFFAAGVYITAFLSTSIMEVLKERVIDLSKSHEEIEAVNQLKDRFILRVAHNLKAPLATTIDMLDILDREYMGELNSKQKEYIERIDGRLKTMIAMLQDLLALTRSREETRNPQKELVDLLDIHQCICRVYADKARTKGLDFQVDLPQEPVLIDGDKDMLEQMVENLISNAVKYTEKGNVEIKLRHRTDGWIIIQVKDTGIGIPKDDMGYLFSDFFRAKNAKKIQAFGTGLGLALIKQAAEQHKGNVEIHSKEGEGTVFTVKLPS
ncbi:MAG: ATP-binding protein [Acidobacteria bacterium]|jgi:signal transduction histidine kinase|nr:ATP-binding protein [Acidobacteriota bacterium]